jgi:amino acid adenylation domain-containing protein
LKQRLKVLEENLLALKRREKEICQAVAQWNRRSWFKRAFHRLRLGPPTVIKPSDSKMIPMRINRDTRCERAHSQKTHGLCIVKPIHLLFEARALENPDAIALQIAGETICYGELDRSIFNLTKRMERLGVTPGNPVALYVDTSAEMVIGYFAILKYGCIAVPIDTDSVPARRKMILTDSGAAFVLVRAKFHELLSQDGLELINVDIRESETEAEKPVQNECSVTIPLTKPALIIYTSGSTGVPKGVVVTHANLAHYVSALQSLFTIKKDDVYLFRGSISLIVSARQLLMPLSLGASVVMATDAERKDPLKLLALVKSARVTIFDHVPSFWKGLEAALLHIEEGERLLLFDLDVRVVAAGGESLPVEIARFLFAAFKRDTAFYNLYGQTEGTGVVSAHRITQSDISSRSPIPVGMPVMGMRMWVVDEMLQPLTDNKKGEICIFGNGVAMGYWNRVALTDKYFVLRAHDRNGSADQSHVRIYRTGDYGRYREDGEIELLGRIDNQVKIRGHRVELEEIEKAMQEYPLIDKAVVVSCPNEFGEAMILAYFQAGQHVETVGLITFLSGILAPHMLPTRYMQIAQFPMTGSGKVDRQVLHSPEFKNQASTNRYRVIRRPLDELQQRIAKVWQTVLDVEEVSIDDNFFSLGGDSLKAITLILSVEKELGYSIPIEEFNQFSSIERFTNDIRTRRHQNSRVSGSLNDQEYKKLLMIILGSKIPQLKPGSLMLQINNNGHLPPLFWCFNEPQKEMSALAGRLPGSQPLFGLVSSVPLENNQATLEKVAAHYVDELSSHFPNGPFRLGGNCRGAKVVCEMIRMFHARNIKVESVCLLEFFHPDLYRFDGELCLLFGRYSHLQRFDLLKFDQEGWEKPFKKRPRAEWINCEHGVFFEEQNVEDLARNIRQWLYGGNAEAG